MEIFDAIAGAAAIVIVLSPDWLESAYCRQELDQALHVRKRLVPVLVRPVDTSKVPPQILDLNWVRYDQLAPEAALAVLLRALALDIDRLRFHARLFQRAQEWSTSRDPSRLLRSHALDEAEQWLKDAQAGEGEPTAVQRDFIVESRRAENVCQRRPLWSVSAALALTAVLAVTAFVFYRSAEARRRIAQSRSFAAESESRRDTKRSSVRARPSASCRPVSDLRHRRADVRTARTRNTAAWQLREMHRLKQLGG